MKESEMSAIPFEDLYLPVHRSNEGLGDDRSYVDSAVSQVRELQQFCGVDEQTRLLDFGCGQGRLAIGLQAAGVRVGSYYGIDTNLESVQWAERWIERLHPQHHFVHVAAHNARYNPAGRPRRPLELGPRAFDVLFANSVFSHMLDEDLRFYLRELNRYAASGATLYVTSFLEDNVPPVEENPSGYLGRVSKGRLHRVRYERAYFLGIVENSGFEVVECRHRGVERTGQSVVVAKAVDDS